MDIVAIDSHTHINHNSKWDTKTNDVYKADLDSILEISDSANIDKILCTTFSSVIADKDIEESNDYMFDLSKNNDRIYQWVVVDPRRETTFFQAEEMLKSKKCVGIKIHPDYHGYSVFDHGDKIFSFAAEREAVVLMHPQVPVSDITNYADKYPKTKIIVAHLGGVGHVDAIANAKHRNVYTDTSGSASTQNFVVEYAVKRVGSENILFGTDSYASGFQRGRIEYALISDKDKENILRNNARRLFEKLS